MPAEPLQPLHDAWIASVNAMLETKARCEAEVAAALAAARAKADAEIADVEARERAANAAYAAGMPEGVAFTDGTGSYFRHGDRVVGGPPHPLAQPYTPPEATN